MDRATRTRPASRAVEHTVTHDRHRLRPVITVVLLTMITGFVFSQLSPGDIVTPTTPTGGDVGAHVWLPHTLGRLLPHLNGWTDDWFAGFPAALHYFPLPALITDALSTVFPYGTAMKLVIVAGALTLPSAVWYFGRSARLRSPTPELMAAACVPFLFDQFHTIYGGNIASVFAGMFSVSLGMSCAFVAAAEAFRVIDGERRRARLATAIAAGALCHLLAAVLVGLLVAAVVTVGGPIRSARHRWSKAWASCAAGLGVAAVWVIPFLWNVSATTDMGYARVVGWRWLTPFLSDTFPAGETRHMWWLAVTVPLAAAGAFIGRPRALRPIMVVAACAAFGYEALALPGVWNARWLPYWYLMCYLAGAIVVAAAIRHLLDHMPATTSRSPLPAVSLVAVLAIMYPAMAAVGVLPDGMPLVPATSGMSSVPGWAHWDLSGYETKPAWPEYRHVMAYMSDIGAHRGCGRAVWEYDPDQGRYGSPMAMMLLPYWTAGCIDSTEGLYFEASQTTPFVFEIQSATSQHGSRPVRGIPYRSFDLGWGVPAMRALGVRYYLAYNDTTRDIARARPDLTELGHAGHFTVFEIVRWSPTAAVTISTEHVVTGDMKAAWAPAFDADPTGSFTDAVTDAALRTAIAANGPDAGVSNLNAGDGHVSFDVAHVGAPVVVRQSWSVNWSATGARGPFRYGPNMMVVIPTGSHVELHAGTAPGTTIGELTALGGLCGVAWLWWADHRRSGTRRRVRRRADDSDQPDEHLAGPPDVTAGR